VGLLSPHEILTRAAPVIRVDVSFRKVRFFIDGVVSKVGKTPVRSDV
jgi:hypothetical protein